MLRYQIIPVTPFQQNCTVFWNEDTKKGGIVDPGGDLQLLNKFIDEQGIEIEKILVTHGHLDHAGSVKAMADERQIPIIGPHKDDKFWIDGMPEAAAQYGFPEALAFEPDQWLEHGDTVEVAGVEFNVVHCPGHTPGHVVFVQSEDKIAMVGDVIFQGSIGRTDFPKGNYQQLIDSITERLWPLGLDITFIPGHGPTSTFDAEKKTNPFVSDGALN
jgi:glyoxylase-like metal-dependent hydrolase (beta-lactamase superfamily II)